GGGAGRDCDASRSDGRVHGRACRPPPGRQAGRQMQGRQRPRGQTQASSSVPPWKGKERPCRASLHHCTAAARYCCEPPPDCPPELPPLEPPCERPDCEPPE